MDQLPGAVNGKESRYPGSDLGLQRKPRALSTSLSGRDLFGVSYPKLLPLFDGFKSIDEDKQE